MLVIKIGWALGSANDRVGRCVHVRAQDGKARIAAEAGASAKGATQSIVCPDMNPTGMA
ncbi:hypothetical protein [Undibacterium sp. Xuan67W]|uniref:hypothetical protein n=1 Tax=Undibacterium sp. Xuan67W TaxID=3413057 RepID=UPI003BF353DB